MQRSFQRVVTRSQLAPGEMTSVEIGGEHIAICNVDGEFYAFHDQCTHELFPLSRGRLEGKTVMCLLHGARFDITTGAVLSAPACEGLKTYPVRVDGDDILVAVAR